MDQGLIYFNLLAQSLPDALCLIFDKELRFIEAGGGAMERGGLTREGLLGRTLREALPPDAADFLEPHYRAALAGDHATFDLPFADGVYEIKILPVPNPAGEVVAGMVIASDITFKRDIASRMRRFQTIVENAADAVIVFNMQGKIEYANAAAAHLYAVPGPDDLIGRPGDWSLAPETTEEMVREIGEAIQREGSWRGRIWNQLGDGQQILVEAVSFPLLDEQGRPTSSATISRDVTNMARAEEEQVALQQGIIEAQQAALRELSTPLIPLADNVVVMPIIGTIDSSRATQIMETLLEGIATNQADIALLDISGVRVVDTQVADALLRAAKAAKLLGTRIVLTGIKAEVAQTVVHLGADMREIITRSNLQEGLRYALEQAGIEMGGSTNR